MKPPKCEVCGATPVRQWFDRLLCERHIAAGNELVRPRLPCHDGNCREDWKRAVRAVVCWECAGYGTLDRAVELMKAEDALKQPGGKEG